MSLTLNLDDIEEFRVVDKTGNVFRLVSEDEYRAFREERGAGDTKWMCNKANCKTLETLSNRILIPFKSELEEKIVKYGKRGKGHECNKVHFLNWFDDNYERID